MANFSLEDARKASYSLKVKGERREAKGRRLQHCLEDARGASYRTAQSAYCLGEEAR